MWCSLLFISLIAPCNPRHLTLNGTTSQSTDYKSDENVTFISSQSSDCMSKDNVTFISERAIDGNEAAGAHTMHLQNSWWRIDLLGVYNISSIMIYHRKQHNSHINSTQVYIGNSHKNNSTNNAMCKNITNYTHDMWISFNCKTSTSGRYVTVFSPESRPLILCEVRICGTRQESPFELIKQNKTWEEALDYCRSRYRDLASVLEEETQAWAEFEAKRAQTAFVWLGLHCTCVLEFWFWVEDHRLDFSRWANKTEECDMSVAMETQEEHLWFSRSDYEKFNFICTK